MKPIVRKINSVLDAHLGRCQKCVRTSFLVMLATGCLALAVTTMTNSLYLIVAVDVLAVCSAGLWFTHLTAFALRAVRSARISCKTAPSRNSNADHALRARRQFISVFAKSFMFAMMATALPIRSVFAADCPCKAPLKCCWDYTVKLYVCAAPDDVCCTGTSPWSCPNGQTCNGDSGGCK